MHNETNEKKYNAYWMWMLLEIFLLLVDIYVPLKLEMSRLNTVEVVNIAFDWMGMFTAIIILNSCIHGRKTKSSNSFMILTIVVFLILFFEVGAWTVDNIAQFRNLNYLCNIGCNSAMLLGTIVYIEYVCKSLQIDRQKFMVLYKSVIGMLILGIAAEILNYWMGFFYIVDAEGIYRRGSFGSVMGFIPFLYILGVSCFLVLKQNISNNRKMDYLSYAIIPMVISIWYTITGKPPTLFMSPFIAMIFIYGNIYVRQGQEMELFILENARKDAELAWQRNQLTRSQIKPHFIFNCLGSIEQLCRIDAEEARKAMHRFAKYLRVNMDAMSEQSLVPFMSELEHIRNYVWLEQMRFEEDLEYEEEIETTDFRLPPLSIQPIVENAIKHGMMGKEDGTLKVTLIVHETDEFYEIHINDNGNGFDENQNLKDGRSHIGIQNVRKSLENLVNGRITINSRIGEGTLVTIRIPKEDNEDLSLEWEDND